MIKFRKGLILFFILILFWSNCAYSDNLRVPIIEKNRIHKTLPKVSKELAVTGVKYNKNILQIAPADGRTRPA